MTAPLRMPAKTDLELPTPCPEGGCGVLLQRQDGKPKAGVDPHYNTCHPGVRPPRVKGVHPIIQNG